MRTIAFHEPATESKRPKEVKETWKNPGMNLFIEFND